MHHMLLEWHQVVPGGKNWRNSRLLKKMEKKLSILIHIFDIMDIPTKYKEAKH